MKKIIINIFALLLGVVTILPFLWMISASLMPTGSANVFPPKFFPESIDFSHYINLLTRMNLADSLFNSLFVSLGVTFFSLVLNSMSGYAFAKFRFSGKKRLFNFLLSSMVIPAQVAMLPLFLLLKNLGLINSYWAVIIPGMASIFGIFLIRQFTYSISDSLIEAAKMDGANEFQIYLRIILPLCKPILVTLGLFTFMGTWNDFLWPLIVMTDSGMYTMPVALANMMGEHVQDTELMMAGSVITIIPVLLVFLALQKFYIRGIMMGSVKG